MSPPFSLHSRISILRVHRSRIHTISCRILHVRVGPTRHRFVCTRANSRTHSYTPKSDRSIRSTSLQYSPAWPLSSPLVVLTSRGPPYHPEKTRVLLVHQWSEPRIREIHDYQSSYDATTKRQRVYTFPRESRKIDARSARARTFFRERTNICHAGEIDLTGDA